MEKILIYIFYTKKLFLKFKYVIKWITNKYLIISSNTTRDVKRVAARRASSFNRKIYRVSAAIFLVRKNSDFFGPDRLAHGPLRLARVGLWLTGWSTIFSCFCTKRLFLKFKYVIKWIINKHLIIALNMTFKVVTLHILQ